MINYKKHNPLFNQVLDKMKYQFSSKEFNTYAKKIGVTDYEIQVERHFKFLLQVCDRIGRSTWRKKNAKTETLFNPVPIIEAKGLPMSDEQMIQHLKNKGYKILRQTFTEL
jgi:hypothetical protein